MILGVDVGTKHFGLALADGPLARPLSSFAHQSVPESAARLAELAADHSAGTIVLGLPEGEIARLVHALTEELAKHTDIPVVTHPESLSTKEAIAKLRQAGASKIKLQDDHSYAACLILEDYLESNPSQ